MNPVMDKTRTHLENERAAAEKWGVICLDSLITLFPQIYSQLAAAAGRSHVVDLGTIWLFENNKN
jgi:hypothetical protein